MKAALSDEQQSDASCGNASLCLWFISLTTPESEESRWRECKTGSEHQRDGLKGQEAENFQPACGVKTSFYFTISVNGQGYLPPACCCVPTSRRHQTDERATFAPFSGSFLSAKCEGQSFSIAVQTADWAAADRATGEGIAAPTAKWSGQLGRVIVLKLSIGQQ
eukprot:56339-Rhodomonas_salina.2